MAERPLSPHLSIYRFAYTMTLSILHRITGVALAVCFIGFVIWLVGIALGANAYGVLLPALHSWPIQILIALALIALVYHFCNGLRHLAWDMGWGFERREARRSATTVVIATVLLGLACLYFLFRRGLGGL
jgi:succinate dehydrogenase / fumarate reductase cytochrome b subunit